MGLQVRKAEETPYAKALNSERDSMFRDEAEVCTKCGEAQAVKVLQDNSVWGEKDGIREDR